MAESQSHGARKAVFSRLADLARADREAKGVTEDEVLDDFRAWRRPRPRVGFVDSGDPSAARRVDELLADGFGH